MTAATRQRPLHAVPPAKCHHCGEDNSLAVLCWRESAKAPSRHEFYCQTEMECWAAHERRYTTLQRLGFIAYDEVH